MKTMGLSQSTSLPLMLLGASGRNLLADDKKVDVTVVSAGAFKTGGNRSYWAIS